MTIVIHDLGDLELCSAEEKANKVLEALCRTGQQDSSQLYRGLMANKKKIKQIILHGTDRYEERESQLQLDQDIVQVAGIEAAREELKAAKVHETSTTGFFAAPAHELEYVIGTYATMGENDPKDSNPLVLVYRGEMLEQDYYTPDFFHVKKGFKPIDAILTGFRFEE